MRRRLFSQVLPHSHRRAVPLFIALLLGHSGGLSEALADSPPVITEQPQPQTSFVGANINLHVAATSLNGARYHWRFHGTNLPNNFPGQATSLLQLQDVTAEDTGPYSVVVSNNFGSVTSQTAMVTVNEFSGGPGAFVNLDARPNFSLFSQGLWQPDQTVDALLPIVPNGASLFKLDGNGFIANNFLDGWSAPEMLLTQGEGWFFYNPTTNLFQLTFVGALVEGFLTNRLPAGHSLSASLLPQGGLLSSDLGFPALPGAKAYLFDRQSQNYVRYEFGQAGWDPFEPTVSASMAFWAYEPSNVDWVREFIDVTPGSYRIVQPMLSNEIGEVNFFTYNVDGVSGRVMDLGGSTPLGSDFLGQLYAGTTDLETSLLPVGKPAPFLDGAGSGYIRSTMVKIPGVPGGQTIFLQLRVWEKNAGDSYEQAVFNGSASGRSAIFSEVAHATFENGGPGLPPRNANTFPMFQISPGHSAPIRIARMELKDGAIELCFATQPGWIYGLQKTSTANQPMTWTALAGAEQIIGTGHVAKITDTASSEQRFYRVCRVQ